MYILQTKSEEGIITLSDGTKLKLKITIIDIRESGFSPFGGINLITKTVGGIGVINIPQELLDEVSDKPLASSTDPPRDGWEIIDIVEYSPAIIEETIDTSKGTYLVRVQAEPVMCSRNMNYKTNLNEPFYWLSWVSKISWKPMKE